jgi:ParB family chromosome partitioning protein
MAVKKSGLGKGLDSLIPNQIKKNEDKNSNKEKNLNNNIEIEKVKKGEKKIEKSEEKEKKLETMIKVTKIEPNPTQPRKHFEEDGLLELAESIKQFGLIQPIIVQKRTDYYEIIAGERRWRAAKLAGLKEVPAIIKEYNEQEIVEISLIENIQRENLNPIEEAMAYRRLLQEFNLKQDEVAERVSKSRTTVTNSMRLLKLDDRVQQMVIDDMISTGHARTLLSIENPENQYTIAMKIFDEKLSVRETEKLVKLLQKPQKSKKEKEIVNDFIYRDIEEKIKSIIGTKVIVNHKANNKGKIEIEYYSNDELERLLELFESIG